MNVSIRLSTMLVLAMLPLSTVSTGAESAAATPAVSAAADPRKDSALVRKYKVGNRPFTRQELKELQTALQFKPVGKPESSAVLIAYRDAKGASFSFEGSVSEWAYANDSLPQLTPRDTVPDSLIRGKTDVHLRTFLREKAAQYAFVNFEVTQMQERDTSSKAGVKPAVPVYYIGRYLRKLNGRYILGDRFQVRIGVGRGNAVSFISYRDPALIDSSQLVKIPTREMVEEYLAKWAREPGRLGTRHYPFHPDKLRIRKLKPVKVFESYVLMPEKYRESPAKDGVYLVPRITVLAEADLARSTRQLKEPHPQAPVLLHFHFPCTPGAGLCWPDGKQGLEDGPQAGIGPKSAVQPAGGTAPAASPKSGPTSTPAQTAPTKP
jgi:hypothetical protein